MKLSRFTYLLVVLALALRMAVPAGWMPSGEKGFALTVCAGTETSTVWIDTNGKIHESDPSKSGEHDDISHEPCAFAGTALALGIPDAATAPALTVAPARHIASLPSEVTIGRGLAAPPPPPTGPPSLI